MKSFVRIYSLHWADVLVSYALFVMQKYLTEVWKLSFTHAAGIMNIWSGVSKILPVFFRFLVDTRLGNFRMLVISSISYSVGIGFVTMSTPPVLANSTGTCKKYEPSCIGHSQRVLFYTGMALIAVGLAGNLVSVISFVGEQRDNTETDSPIREIAQIFGFIPVVLVPIVGGIALPYIKPWKLRFGIPAICTAFATACFLTGSCRYCKVPPGGSPITNVCRVFVASAFKMFQPYPLNDSRLYRNQDENLQSFSSTRFLRCLEKAAIMRDDMSPEDQVKRWRLCPVAEVEEAKKAVRMVPMWLTFIICGTVSAIGNTYFVEQANHLNRHLGKWNVPLPAFLVLFEWFKMWFEEWASGLLKTPTKYAPPVGIAVAMAFSILCCITAAKTEERRQNVIRKHNLFEKPDKDFPMSAYWLLFQFFLLAGLDSFLQKSVVALAPESMGKYLDYFTQAMTGLGFMFSVLSVHVVGKVSEKGGRRSWFQYTLNKSRLDRYYWVLAVMSSVNLLVFVVVASCYRYPNRKAVDAAGGRRHSQFGGGANTEEPSFSCNCC